MMMVMHAWSLMAINSKIKVSKKSRQRKRVKFAWNMMLWVTNIQVWHYFSNSTPTLILERLSIQAFSLSRKERFFHHHLLLILDLFSDQNHDALASLDFLVVSSSRVFRLPIYSPDSSLWSHASTLLFGDDAVSQTLYSVIEGVFGCLEAILIVQQWKLGSSRSLMSHWRVIQLKFPCKERGTLR